MKTKLDNRGFSLVELIATIAVFAILTSIIGVAAMNQLEKAKKTEALTSAENICTAAQTALVDTAANKSNEFLASLKYTKDGEAVGVFSSQLMYKYLDMGDPESLYDTVADADKLECYLAEIVSNTIAGSDRYTITAAMTSNSPVGSGQSSLSFAGNESQYGPIVFSMVYNGKCEILYFECVYKGYYVKIEGTDYVAANASDELRFQTWP